ncbi:hypothetical protein BB560_000954 [Smittium megazygosporum]|uniref:DNA-directed RNA polymerase M/15kDa subunit domain-containing protein n=1 Tax=Smittium megazygosporum TaxID=133381 RepID=A0A2T9ZIY0_9FUNG|nr:hypothetical protein BB560_000954 [Smittium megazygosporum]
MEAEDVKVRNIIYGSLIFCNTCDSLLDIPGDQDFIVCHVCGDTKAGKDFENIETVTVTKPSAFPSVLRNKRSLIKGISDSQVEQATV